MNAEVLENALEHSDAETRRQAIASLPHYEGEGDVGGWILRGLGDADWRVRKEATRIAHEIGKKENLVPRFVSALLQNENVGLRNSALDVLAHLGPEVVDYVLEVFPGMKPPQQKFLLDALGDTRDERVVHLLVEASRSEDPNLVSAALDGLARVGGALAERTLRERLLSSNPFHCMAAVDGLSRLGAVVPWEELKALLSDRIVKRAALPLFGRCNRIEAMAPLLEALREPSLHVVALAVTSIAQLCEGKIKDPVLDRLQGLSERDRAAIRRVLRDGDLGARQAAALLMAGMRDEASLDGVLELGAVNAWLPSILDALKQWGDAAVRPLIVCARRLRGAQQGVALELASDLVQASIRAKEDVALVNEMREELRQALRSADPFVVLSVIRGLTYWVEPVDAPSLIRLASSPHEFVAKAAGDALDQLSQTNRQTVESAVEEAAREGHMGPVLTRVAAHVHGHMSLDLLQRALSSDEPATRRSAVEGFASFHDARVPELIAFALADDSEEVQMAAAEALGKFRDEQGHSSDPETLRIALTSSSPSVRAVVARAIGKAGDKNAIELLRPLLHSSDSGVILAAVEALKALDDTHLSESLVECLGHSDPEVVKVALRALSTTKGTRVSARVAVGLEHPSWDVRALSAKILGELSDKGAALMLRERLAREADDLVKAAIHEALTLLGGSA